MADLLSAAAQEQEAAKLTEIRRRFDPSRYHKEDQRPVDLGSFTSAIPIEGSTTSSGAQQSGERNSMTKSMPRPEVDINAQRKTMPRPTEVEIKATTFTDEDWVDLELFDDEHEIVMMNDEIEVMMREIETALIGEIEEAHRRRLIEEHPPRSLTHMNDDDEDLMDEILEEVLGT